MKITKIYLRCIIIFAFIFFCRQAFAEKLDKIAAIVNGDVITEDEVGTFMKMTDLAEESGLSVNNPKELRRELLNRMIEDRLVLQEAKNMELKVDEKMIDERIKEIKVRAGSELAFDMALKQQGFSLNELRKKFKNQLMIFMAIQKEVRAKVQVSPKEVTEYYDTHQDRFLVPESVVADSIFVKDKEALDQVTKLLDEGREFLEVAHTFSQKTSIGVVTRGQLKKELEDVLFSLQIGERSKPVSTSDGFYLFLVREKRPPQKRALEDVKDEISAKIEKEKMEKKLKEWVESLKDKAYISIREE